MAISKLLVNNTYSSTVRRGKAIVITIVMTGNNSSEMQLGFLRSVGEGRESTVPAFRTVLVAAIPSRLQGGTTGPVMLPRDL